MSGICALYDPTGAAIDLDLLRRLATTARHRGPDGIAYWLDAGVGLAHLALNATPSARRSRQPALADNRRTCLVADLRLDNRVELERALVPGGTLRAHQPTDVDLLLAAYERWVEECPRHLEGDFAFALWDRERRWLFCARDGAGVKPLFYAMVGPLLCVASEVEQILALPAARADFDEAAVIACLAGLDDGESTLLAGIRRLPAGHSLTVASSLRRPVRRRREPAGDDGAPLAPRAALHRAVARRAVTARGRLAVVVSGGAAGRTLLELAAAAAREAGEPPPLGLALATIGTPETTPDGPELEVVSLDPERHPLRLEASSPATPQLNWRSAEEALFEHARRAGASVLLTAQGAPPAAGRPAPPPWLAPVRPTVPVTAAAWPGADGYPLSLAAPSLAWALAALDLDAARHGLEVRHPFLDPLVANHSSLAPTDGAVPGTPSPTLAEVMVLLGQALRRDSGHQLGDLVSGSRLAARRWVDGERLAAAVAAFLASSAPLDPALWRTLAIESWLRTRAG